MADDQPGVVAAGGWCAPSETIYELATGMNARERMLWRGEVEPTPEERQAAADELYAQEVLDNRNWFDTGVFLERLKRITFTGVAKDILDLHARTESGICNVCVTGWETSVQWPCSTALIVLRAWMDDIPEEFVYEKPEPVVQDPDNPRWPFPSGPVDPFTFPEVKATRGGIRYPTPAPVDVQRPYWLPYGDQRGE